MKEDLRALGVNIRSWRQRSQFTLGQLAEMTGLDLSFLNNIELGARTPSLATVSTIAKALGVSLEELFKGTPKPSNDFDYQVVQQVRALFKGKTPAEKSELVAVLKVLKDPKMLRAIQQLVR